LADQSGFEGLKTFSHNLQDVPQQLKAAVVFGALDWFVVEDEDIGAFEEC